MRQKNPSILIYLIIIYIAAILPIPEAHAFWLWTRGMNKLINPKFAVKDTPEAQYDWAMTFFNAREYIRAAEEFNRLIQFYPNAKLAPDAQYYAGISYQKAGKYYVAFENYQKALKNYPFSERIGDIVNAQYELGQYYYDSSTAVLMGVDIMTDVDRAAEIFQAIVDNVPFSDLADEAQFMVGQCYKKLSQFSEAVTAFQKLVTEYPKSELVVKAKYEIAECMYLLSQQAEYDQETTDEAIAEFKKYSHELGKDKININAEETLDVLIERKAEGIYKSAYFYERQKKYISAAMYYKDIIKNYGQTKHAELARERMKAIEPYLEKAKNENK